MKTRLLNGLEDGMSDLIKSQYQSSYKLRERMVEILERDVDNVHKSMRSDEEYGPSWAYLQAERVGEVKALKKLIGLLE